MVFNVSKVFIFSYSTISNKIWCVFVAPGSVPVVAFTRAYEQCCTSALALAPCKREALIYDRINISGFDQFFELDKIFGV